MNQPKRQHWIPQFYLEYFATSETYNTNNPKVWILSKDENDKDEFITNIKNICVKGYLYSPIDNIGIRDWELENKFNVLETLLSKIWKNIANKFINLEDYYLRKALSLFVATLYLRHPDTFQETIKNHKNLVSFYKNFFNDSNTFENTQSIEINGKLFDMDLSDWNNYHRWKKDNSQKFWISFIEKEAINLAQILMKKRWSIIFTEFDQFITTDKPVVKFNQHQQIHGFETNGTIIIFPLSQRRLLVMDDLYDEPMNQYYPLKSNQLGLFNYLLWHNSSRFMISGRPISDVLSEIVLWEDNMIKT